jgi:hypothetical protein
MSEVGGPTAAAAAADAVGGPDQSRDLADPDLYALVRLWSSDFTGGLGRRAWISAVGGVKTAWGKSDLTSGGVRLDEHLQPGTGAPAHRHQRLPLQVRQLGPGEPRLRAQAGEDLGRRPGAQLPQRRPRPHRRGGDPRSQHGRTAALRYPPPGRRFRPRPGGTSGRAGAGLQGSQRRPAREGGGQRRADVSVLRSLTPGGNRTPSPGGACRFPDRCSPTGAPARGAGAAPGRRRGAGTSSPPPPRPQH